MTCKDYGALPKLWVPLLTNNSSRGGGGQTSHITQLASFIPFLYSQRLLFHWFPLVGALPPPYKEHKDRWAPWDLLNTGMTSRQDNAIPVSQPCLSPCLKWKEQPLINPTAARRQERIPFKTQLEPWLQLATRAVKCLTPRYVQPDFNATHTVQPQRRHTAEMRLLPLIARDGLVLGYWQKRNFRLSYAS